MQDLLFIDKMLTPKLITALYWLLLTVVAFTGLGTILSALSFMSLYLFMYGILTIVVGGILVRVWCEMLIVLFKINDNLTRIADK